MASPRVFAPPTSRRAVAHPAARSVARSAARSAALAAFIGLAGAAACSDAPTQPPGGGPAAAHGVDASVAIGDTVLLNVRVDSGAPGDNVGAGNADCGAPHLVKARVAAISNRAVVVADTRNPVRGFSDAEYASIGATFDTLVWPVDTRHFGVPTDVDRNGRVVVFYTRAVNGLTPAGAGFYVGGFFYPRDLLPTAGAHACPGSNGGEILYLLAPDPDGTVNGNRRDPAFVARVTVGTVAHEFQHLINAARRLYVLNGHKYDEEVWLNEGLSHAAEELAFYQSGAFSPPGQPGQSPRARLTGTRVLAQPNGFAALNGFGLQNLSRLGLYLGATERYAPYTENDSLQTRGATWSFLRYAADRAGGSDSAFFYPLVNSPTTGVANVRAVVAAAGGTLEDALRDWAVSSYADGLVPRLDARFTQPSWAFRDVLTTLQLQTGTGGPMPLSSGTYPLHPRTLSNGASQTFSLGGGSAAYLEFVVPVGGTATLRTTSGGTAPPATARLAVVQATGPSAGTVTTYDGAAGASVRVPNASPGALRAALVVFNAGTTASARQAFTVTGTGIGAPAAIVSAPASIVVGPTRARLAAGGVTDPVMSDAAVMRRLHAASRLTLAPRVDAARAAYRAARRTGDFGAWARRHYTPGTMPGPAVPGPTVRP